VRSSDAKPDAIVDIAGQATTDVTRVYARLVDPMTEILARYPEALTGLDFQAACVHNGRIGHAPRCGSIQGMPVTRPL
jgi:hypothetical protein